MSMLEINRDRLTSPYKKYRTSLKKGTYLELMGEVSVTAPNVCVYTDRYDLISAGQCMPSPIALILTSKIYENDIQVTISYTTGVFSRWDVREEPIYVVGASSLANVTIPAYSKEGEVFIVPDVRNCVDVTGVGVAGGTRGTETFKIMALASSNTRILYLEDFSDIKKLLEDAKWHRYINQLPCWTCRGTGLLRGIVCPTCNGFTQDKYAAWLKSIEYIGLDLNRLRESEETDIEYQRRLWGHRRWVIPRKPDDLELNIASVFAHYLDVAERYIHIYEVPAQFDGNDEVYPPGTYFSSWYLDPTSDPSDYTVTDEVLNNGSYWYLDQYLWEEVLPDYNFSGMPTFVTFNGHITDRYLVTPADGPWTTNWLLNFVGAPDPPNTVSHLTCSGAGAGSTAYVRHTSPFPPPFPLTYYMEVLHRIDYKGSVGKYGQHEHIRYQDVDLTAANQMIFDWVMIYTDNRSYNYCYFYIDVHIHDAGDPIGAGNRVYRAWFPATVNGTTIPGTAIINVTGYTGPMRVTIRTYTDAYVRHDEWNTRWMQGIIEIHPVHISAYKPEGFITTRKVFTHNDVSRESIFKSILTPSGTSVNMRYKTSETEAGLDTASWSSWTTNDAYTLPSGDIKPWIQWQLRLYTTSYTTPRVYNTYVTYDYYSGAWTVPGTHNINPIWICSMPGEYWGENYWWHAEQDEVNFRKMVESLNPLGTVARTEFYLNVPPESEDPTYNPNMKDTPKYTDRGSIIFEVTHTFDYWKEVVFDGVLLYDIPFTALAGRCYYDSIRLSKITNYAIDPINCMIYDQYRDCWENFSNDADGGNPDTNWVTLEPGSTSVEVLSSFANFKKVVKIYDNDGAQKASITHTFTAGQASGTVYLISAADQTNKSLRILNLLDQLGFPCITIGFYNTGTFFYYDGVGITDSTIPYSANVMYIFKIEFECGAGAYKGLAADKYNAYYWNGSSWSAICLNKDTRTNANTIDDIYIDTYVADTGTMYVSAVDYSWASGYVEDRILNLTNCIIAHENTENEDFWVLYHASTKGDIYATISTGSTDSSTYLGSEQTGNISHEEDF